MRVGRGGAVGGGAAGAGGVGGRYGGAACGGRGGGWGGMSVDCRGVVRHSVDERLSAVSPHDSAVCSTVAVCSSVGLGYRGTGSRGDVMSSVSVGVHLI